MGAMAAFHLYFLLYRHSGFWAQVWYAKVCTAQYKKAAEE
jgi:hypothetical protein